MGVEIGPGLTTFTRIPLGASSEEMLRARERTAATFSLICSTNACCCSPGRNLKNRETECKSASGFPLSRFAPARKSAQIISKQCGRSPDHKAKRDGQFELEQYACKLPAVDPATTARFPVKVSDYGLPLLVVLRVTFHFTQPLMNCGVN